MARKATNKEPTAADLLAKVGLEAICLRIERGESQAEIAKALKVDAGELSRWLNSDAHAQRSARAREASAESWLDRGLEAVRSSLKKKGAVDPSAAKAFAQECARRAALRNPRYVEKTAHEFSGPNGGPIDNVLRVEFVGKA